MLSIKNVSKTYGSHQALSQVSIEVKPGEIFGLLGPNGAGKTSLIRIINQITAPDSGQVLFEGHPLQRQHIMNIGYLPEERGLYPKMRVREQLLYLAQLKGVEKSTALSRIDNWLHRFELNAWKNKSIEELSKGMAQKVQFIATIVHEPKLLIFDEPFTGFDPVNTNLIKDEIRQLKKKGHTIIFSTHRMDSVEELCDEIALLHQSEKILEGRVQAVREKFKEGVYRFEIKGEEPEQLPEGFEWLSREKQLGYWVLRMRCPDEKIPELLRQMAGRFHVHSFREEIPSLNDIFIKTVQA